MVESSKENFVVRPQLSLARTTIYIRVDVPTRCTWHSAIAVCRAPHWPQAQASSFMFQLALSSQVSHLLLTGFDKQNGALNTLQRRTAAYRFFISSCCEISTERTLIPSAWIVSRRKDSYCSTRKVLFCIQMNHSQGTIDNLAIGVKAC